MSRTFSKIVKQQTSAILTEVRFFIHAGLVTAQTRDYEKHYNCIKWKERV